MAPKATGLTQGAPDAGLASGVFDFSSRLPISAGGRSSLSGDLAGKHSDFNNLSGPYRPEHREHFRQMRPKIVNVIRVSADDQDRDPAICDVLLVLEIFIYGD